MFDRNRTDRRRRRGVSLVEMQAAILLIGVLSVPLLTMAHGIFREAVWTRAETEAQWDLDYALWRLTAPLRETVTIETAGTARVQATDARGVRREFYVQDGRLWEKVGTHAPVAIAADVTDLEYSYYQTVAGERVATGHAAQVTEIGVRLTLSRSGFERTGELLAAIRTRAR
jgi:hypothetical protein